MDILTPMQPASGLPISPSPSLPSFKEFVTVLGQESTYPSPDTPHDVASPRGESLKPIWIHEQADKSSINVTQMKKDTFSRGLRTLVSATDTLVPPAKRLRVVGPQPFNPFYTRDGIPRKRLAQACERCRAHKIRCWLDGSRCVQCARQGLECTFTACRRKRRRNDQNREPQSEQDRSREESLHNTAQPIPATMSSVSSEESPMKDSSSPKEPKVPSPASESMQSAITPGGPDHSPSQSQTPDTQTKPTEAEATRKSPALDDLSINIDPMLFDAALTRHYTEQYFTYIDKSPYRLLPRSAFLEWLDTADKGTSELMLLYTVMCAGAIFSTNKHHSEHRMLFGGIAKDALRGCLDCFELPVIHTLLILSCVCAYSGDVASAYAHSTSALRCGFGLQLNNDQAQSLESSSCGYLGTDQAAECCRRTFWLAYIRHVFWNPYLEGRSGSPQLQGCMRLPCGDAAYEAGAVPESPVFAFSSSVDVSRILAEDDRPAAASPMALMISATAALESDTGLASLSPTRQQDEYAASRPVTAREVDWQLKGWRQRTMDTALLYGVTIPVELHIMGTRVAMALHRRTRLDLLTPTQTKRHYRQTRYHAAQLLEQLDLWQDTVSSSATSGWNLDPSAGCAVFMAFDTLTAAGLLSSVLDQRHRTEDGRLTFRSMATLAITIISDLAEYSQLAERQLAAMKQRLAAVLLQSNTCVAPEKRAFYFAEPLWRPNHPSAGRRDVIYGMSKSGILDALGIDGSEEDLLEMIVK